MPRPTLDPNQYGAPPAGRRAAAANHPRPPRRALSLPLIVDTTLRVVDAEGVDAVTMRRVAEELGTGAASLYAHVADKDELLAAVYDRVFADIDVTVSPHPERWAEQIKDFARRQRAALAAHRDLARVGLGSIPTGPNALRAMEAMLSVMDAGGIAPQKISFTGDLLAQFVNASVYEDSLFQSRFDRNRSFHEWTQQMQDVIASLPADRFPTIHRLAPALFDPGEGENERFEFGLEVIIQGLAATMAKPRPARRNRS
ncbi:TetR/AcrR family transcriptional regulator [Acidiferrimicrobium sp. IK]|uniref:TetR/AcrR family transcriptional regulator n=1 Tax=Acidiferrimicrobium sp. IK TaxID=2871700 RepID=UPI0021CB2D96|nr:TetR/AcrR family transcriptional regulator [Acidiferrimicrobium sp. IK]MCU4183041.1 TetR/AcrR family transcriptional regulator [Acidiferrimicrobium sp. IK]